MVVKKAEIKLKEWTKNPARRQMNHVVALFQGPEMPPPLPEEITWAAALSYLGPDSFVL